MSAFTWWVHKRRKLVVIRFKRSLEKRAPEIRRFIEERVAAGKRRFILDFSKTEEIDLAILSMFSSLSKQYSESGVELIFTNMHHDEIREDIERYQKKRLILVKDVA